MFFDIGQEIGLACAPMVAGACVMYITEIALERVSTRRVSRQKEQGKPSVTREPLVNSLGLMKFIMIDPHIEPCVLRRGVAPIQERKQVPEQRMGFTYSQDLEPYPGRPIECSSQGVLGMLVRCHDD